LELSRQIAEQMILLEQQAAQVAALIDGAPPEVVDQVIEAFAPLPVVKGANAKQREVWAATWLRWVADCGDRFEQRPHQHPSGEAMAELFIRWCASSRQSV
jgi:hypothetical protein